MSISQIGTILGAIDWSLALGSLGGIAAFGMMVIGFLTWQSNKESARVAAFTTKDAAVGKAKVDDITLGMESLKGALERADTERHELSEEVRTVKAEAAQARVDSDRDMRALRVEMAALTERYAEQQKAFDIENEACHERVRVLTRELQELRG